MKISAKTLVVVAALSMGAGLLLPLVANSQIHIKRPTPTLVVPDDNPASFNNKRLKDGITTVHIPTELETLTARMDDLEAKVAAQNVKLTAQQTKLAAQDAQLAEQRQLILGHPAGYTRAFITLYNFRNLPDDDAITYWARTK